MGNKLRHDIIIRNYFSKNKLLKQKLHKHFLYKNGLKREFSASVINKYEYDEHIKRELEKYEKYKSTLEIITFTEDEMAVINTLFGSLSNLSSKRREPVQDEIIEINQITYSNTIFFSHEKEYIIDPSTKFDFKFTWRDNAPYAYYIGQVEFNDDHTSAELRYGWHGRCLDGRGFIAKFSKKNNHWEITSGQA
ncbi:hypothetical protein FACS1894190_16300 [Spirochaetia bacterium]|nr:hypothetical protein FACS1894190_16300 [Spirochaetia bacterium]